MPEDIESAGMEKVRVMPISVITRPIPKELDEAKVQSIMETISNPATKDEIPPIDVLWIAGKTIMDNNYFYNFDGAHRYEAHKRLDTKIIKVKVTRTTIDEVKNYLGGEMPADFEQI